MEIAKRESCRLGHDRTPQDDKKNQREVLPTEFPVLPLCRISAHFISSNIGTNIFTNISNPVFFVKEKI
jgi:hypothetical protein